MSKLINRLYPWLTREPKGDCQQWITGRVPLHKKPPEAAQGLNPLNAWTPSLGGCHLLLKGES